MSSTNRETARDYARNVSYCQRRRANTQRRRTNRVSMTRAASLRSALRGTRFASHHQQQTCLINNHYRYEKVFSYQELRINRKRTHLRNPRHKAGRTCNARHSAEEREVKHNKVLRISTDRSMTLNQPACLSLCSRDARVCFAAP